MQTHGCKMLDAFEMEGMRTAEGTVASRAQVPGGVSSLDLCVCQVHQCSSHSSKTAAHSCGDHAPGYDLHMSWILLMLTREQYVGEQLGADVHSRGWHASVHVGRTV